MNPPVLLLPLKCQNHENCNKQHGKLISYISKELPQFSVTKEFEPRGNGVNQLENSNKVSPKWTSTNQILHEYNINTSVTVGVVHIKVEPQDDSEKWE